MVLLMMNDGGRRGTRWMKKMASPGGRVRAASRLELAHAIGQHPQRPVQAQVLVDALHRTGALMAAVGRASTAGPADDVLLDAVEDRIGPQIVLAVVPVAGSEAGGP